MPISYDELQEENERLRNRSDGLVATIEAIRATEQLQQNAYEDWKRVEETNRWLAALVESSEDAIVSKSLDGTIRTWNAGAERLFGYTAQQAVGRHISLIIPVDRAGEENEIIARLAAAKRIEHFDTVRVRRDGLPIEVSLTISPIKDASGQVVGASKIARDITERKRLELELRKNAADLAEADRRKNEFLAMLAHELRNPLAPIRNALHVVRMNIQEQPLAVRPAWAMMERQVVTLVHLVDDLLDISRISQGKIKLEMEPVEVATIVGHAVESSNHLVKEHRHELTVRLPDKPLIVRADVTRMTQVILNLLNNAAKYTPAGGRIWINAEERADEVAIRVRDTGMGIPDDILPRVFDLFTQAQRTLDRAGGGLGIGLTLVRRLTEMHGGTVAASSDGPGRGSEFVVCLPLAQAAFPAVQPTKQPSQEPLAAPGGRRILVVDDNRDSAESLAMLLRLLGHDARMVHEGHQALCVAEELRPELVLLDIGLPGIDGYEVARRLRAEPWGRAATLIALTGYGGDDVRERTESAGFNRHLVKPLDIDVLRRLISELDGPITSSGAMGSSGR
jgi:PAS domain S-box-containing protein